MTLIGRKVTRIGLTSGTLEGNFGGLYGLKDGSVFIKCFCSTAPKGSVKVVEYMDEAKARREGVTNPNLPWKHDFTSEDAHALKCKGGILIKGRKPLWGHR